MNFQTQYPSLRAPTMAANMVATSQPLAAQAGISALQAGGNAVDAALSAAIALTVVEPTSNGIGGDAFAILWDGQQLHGLNASGRSPKGLSADRFKGQSTMPLKGWDTVTVPGAVSAWVELSSRFGKLPFEQLFERAIHYASNGYMVAPVTAHAWQRAQPAYQGFEEFGRVFLPGGQAPRPGQLFTNPDQANTLQEIAATKGQSFYQGALAETMAAEAARNGHPLSVSDLAEHTADWVGTISHGYNQHELHQIPPNGQGLAALIALGILRSFDMAALPPESADSVHLQIEAMKLAFADAYRYISDPATMEFPAQLLLDHNYLASRAKLIDLKRAGNPGHGTPQRGGTVYLTAADASGMMISFIQSNYYGFGSGVVIPGTGIAMQNRGSGFSLTPSHPNVVAGGKRPFHTIIPAFLTRSGQPVMSFGVMGGHMQAQGHVQMVLRVVDHGHNPQAAADAPRWQIAEDTGVILEHGFPQATIDDLAARGHSIRLSAIGADSSFGGAQLIYRTEHGYIGGTDPRKEGMAVGY